MRQRRWLELIKDYDVEINYHPGKADVVADALSRKTYCNNLMVREEQPALHEELEKLRIEIVDHGQVNELRVTCDLEERIRTAQKSCAEIKDLRELMKQGKVEDYRIDEQGTVWLKERICVPQDKALLEQIMRFEVLDPPRQHKDVQRFVYQILVEGHEERYSSLRGLL
jgi:hypothetical protein